MLSNDEAIYAVCKVCSKSQHAQQSCWRHELPCMIVKPHGDTRYWRAARYRGQGTCCSLCRGARSPIHTARALLTCITVFLRVYLEMFRPGWDVARQRSPGYRNVSSGLRSNALAKTVGYTFCLDDYWHIASLQIQELPYVSLEYGDSQQILHASHCMSGSTRASATTTRSAYCELYQSISTPWWLEWAIV